MSFRRIDNKPNLEYPGNLLNGEGRFGMDTLRSESHYYYYYYACVSGRSLHVRSKPFGWIGVT